MLNRDPIEITPDGIRYVRGVHVVSRRPELVVISVNSQGEIVREYRQHMGLSSEDGTDIALALIETGEVLNQRDGLRELEPWLPEVPVFIPPHESKEAAETALDFLEALRLRARGELTNPTERGVHTEVELRDGRYMVVYAMNSRGERVGERLWDLYEDKGEKLVELGEELERILEEVDPA